METSGVWLSPSAAQRPSSRLPQCPCQAWGIHAPRAFSLVPPRSRGTWGGALLPFPLPVRLHSGLVAPFSFRLGLPGRRTWTLGYGSRGADQTPGDARCCSQHGGGDAVASGPAAGQWGQRRPVACPLNSLPCGAARPAAGLWREHVLFWAERLGGGSRNIVQRAQWTARQALPGKGAETVSGQPSDMTQRSGRPDLCADRETLGWELVGGA